MIRLNEILQPRWNSPLVRMFGMKVVGAPAPTLSPEIQPGVDVNQMDDPALFFVRGERIAGSRINIAASVGNFSALRLANPASSGMLVILDEVTCSCTSNCILGLMNDDTSLGTAESSYLRDGRWRNLNGNLTPTAQVTSRNNNVAAPNIWPVGVLAAGQLAPIKTRLVLPPGWSAIIHPSSANIALLASLDWRERILPTEETQTG